LSDIQSSALTQIAHLEGDVEDTEDAIFIRLKTDKLDFSHIGVVSSTLSILEKIALKSFQLNFLAFETNFSVG
jgi:hypothetical protein